MSARSLAGDYYSGTFLPFLVEISNIERGETTLINCAKNHSFFIGSEVFFQIPKEWEIFQLNQQKGFVIKIPSATQIVVRIDSRLYDPFIVPVKENFKALTPAQIVPIGDQNFRGYFREGRGKSDITIEGSFLNIFP